MLEVWAVYRDAVGEHSTVLYEGEPTRIQDLPANKYDLFHRNSKLAFGGLDPNTIPGFLLEYCTRLDAEEFKFKGDSICQKVSNLGVIAEPVNEPSPK